MCVFQMTSPLASVEIFNLKRVHLVGKQRQKKKKKKKNLKNIKISYSAHIIVLSLVLPPMIDYNRLSIT